MATESPSTSESGERITMVFGAVASAKIEYRGHFIKVRPDGSMLTDIPAFEPKAAHEVDKAWYRFIDAVATLIESSSVK